MNVSDVSSQIANIKEQTKRAYNFKVEKLKGMMLSYAGYFLQRYRQKQSKNAYYKNRTGNALAGVKSGAERIENDLVAYLMHTMDYGWPLELANDRKHESIRPTVMAFYSRFMRDVEKIFGD